ncbi:MAG: DNA alkylation repair protein [Flavobacteriales bacterium]|nr:DNA alkylation repair protein [Flavobacteriales bacterium]
MKYHLKELIAFYADHANPDDQGPMAAYMKNKFKFLGIRSPQRRELNRSFFREYGKPVKSELFGIVKSLYGLPEREYHYLAMEIAGVFKKKWDREDLDTIEFMMSHNTWWDSIDFIASNLMGSYLLKYSELKAKLNRSYIKDKSLWVRRVALLFQLKYKEKTDVKMLESNILKCCHETEFFIEKAIGWALREYSKKDAQWVETFISKHQLRPLSVREGLKWLKKNG